MKQPTYQPLRRRAAGLGLLTALALAGCYATAPAPNPPVEGTWSTPVVVDVDPMRGSAFERATRGVLAASVEGALRVQVDFPSVRHDAATGRTTVTMQLTNAGDRLTYLKCQVAGDRKVISPAWPFNTTVTQAGATQTVDLVFENPGGGGFTVNLSFQGILSKSGTLGVGAGGTTPTTSPTATPSPTPSPTATPTPTASSTPTSSGTLSATASSSYAGLGPERAVDRSLSTQWSNDGYQQPEAWLRFDTGAVRTLSAIRLKMRPQSTGAYYDIQVSSDGVNYFTAAAKQRNSSWNLETKTLPSGTQGRYVRLRFVNDPTSPEVRFSVFEGEIDGLSGGTSPTPAPTATPTASPSPSPSPTPAPSGTGLNNTFEQYALGSHPSDFIDPRDEGYSYSWMPQVPWRIVSENGSQQFMHDGLSNQAWLSFRRYRGGAFGTPNGQLPNRYFASVDVTPLKSYTYAPTGDQGTMFYYLNPTNYVELLIKPNLFEVWASNNAEPFQSTGWQRLHYTAINTSAGQKRHLSAEVDAFNGTIKVYLDGRHMTTLSHRHLTTQPHWFAMRGAGNIVVHDNLRIEAR